MNKMLIRNLECAQKTPAGCVGTFTLRLNLHWPRHVQRNQQSRVSLVVDSATSHFELSTVDLDLATRHCCICTIQKSCCGSSAKEKFKLYTRHKHLLLSALSGAGNFSPPWIFCSSVGAKVNTPCPVLKPPLTLQMCFLCIRHHPKGVQFIPNYSIPVNIC